MEQDNAPKRHVGRPPLDNDGPAKNVHIKLTPKQYAKAKKIRNFSALVRAWVEAWMTPEDKPAA